MKSASLFAVGSFAALVAFVADFLSATSYRVLFLVIMTLSVFAIVCLGLAIRKGGRLLLSALPLLLVTFAFVDGALRCVWGARLLDYL